MNATHSSRGSKGRTPRNIREPWPLPPGPSAPFLPSNTKVVIWPGDPEFDWVTLETVALDVVVCDDDEEEDAATVELTVLEEVVWVVECVLEVVALDVAVELVDVVETCVVVEVVVELVVVVANATFRLTELSPT
jgi:hypothetical protein